MDKGTAAKRRHGQLGSSDRETCSCRGNGGVHASESVPKKQGNKSMDCALKLPSLRRWKGAYQPNAGAHPGTVVIKLLDAVVADCTVRAAGRPPMVAGGAPLGLHHKPIDLMLLEAGPSPATTTPCVTLLQGSWPAVRLQTQVTKSWHAEVDHWHARRHQEHLGQAHLWG